MNRTILKRGVDLVDTLLGVAHHRVFGDGPSLLVFTFHALEETRGELEPLVPPDLVNTIGDLRRLVEYYLEGGYKFVTSHQIMRETAEMKLVMLTFDDGYYNNTLALPVLRNFKVPGVFAVSTNFVLQQKAFWWDVLYRERLSRRTNQLCVRTETEALKCHTQLEKEEYLSNRFGQTAIKPKGDADRPLTTKELREISKEPLVEVVNHTSDHLDLTACSEEEIRNQIEESQDSLLRLTGTRPSVLAYPHGARSDTVDRIAVNAGIRLGLGLGWKKNVLPLDRTRVFHTLSRCYAPPDDTTFEDLNRAYRRGPRRPLSAVIRASRGRPVRHQR